MALSNTPRQVMEKSAVVTYKDTTAKELFTLPSNAKILFFLVDVQTAFNDSGTDLLDLGKTGDGDFFADDIDVSAATQIMTQQYELGDVGDGIKTITGTYVGQNSNATAGKAVVTCVYSSKFATRQ